MVLVMLLLLLFSLEWQRNVQFIMYCKVLYFMCSTTNAIYKMKGLYEDLKRPFVCNIISVGDLSDVNKDNNVSYSEK